MQYSKGFVIIHGSLFAFLVNIKTGKNLNATLEVVKKRKNINISCVFCRMRYNMFTGNIEMIYFNFGA